uniref:Uncharacterized protein n=1 Tax=Lactuca sativa TaxID=4236 RepID=A0A9R1XK22_LACSA|nr:hypothetical protein LSAT_V11C400164490 [Lactuca sativa]
MSLRPSRKLGDLFGAVNLKRKRLKRDNSTLWAKAIQCIHDLDGRHWSIFANRSRTGVWKNIVKRRHVLKNFNIDPNEIVYWNPIECQRIELASHVVCDGPFEWCKVIPFKVLCFIWRAKLGRISSTLALKLSHPKTANGGNVLGRRTSCMHHNKCKLAVVVGMVSPSKYDVVLGDKVPVYLVDDVIESQGKDRKENNITGYELTCLIEESVTKTEQNFYSRKRISRDSREISGVSGV